VAVSEADIASYDASNTAAFSRVFAAARENAHRYFERINCRNKLNAQHFENVPIEKYPVLAGAGGGYPCAAYIPMSGIDREKTIVDQTLYWYVAESEDEALYITALLNSRALDACIADFQPKGARGRRHVHKLPYAVTPPFDPEDFTHMFVVNKARLLKNAIDTNIANSDAYEYLSPARSSLAVRRQKIRRFIRSIPENDEYEAACREVYGIY
jgi:hypothetical protein